MNYYDLINGEQWVGSLWKIGKYWLASSAKGPLGGYKSKRKAYAAVLKSLDFKEKSNG